MKKIKKIFVDQLDTSLNPQAGQSKPLAVQGSDGKKYLLKKQIVNIKSQLVNENAVFMQELFVYQLASFLQIPVPGFAILNLEDDFIQMNKDILFSEQLKPGLYFGTEILKNVENNLARNYVHELRAGKPYILKSWNTYFRNVTNSEVYADIIALDYLTLNYDRFTNVGNLLVARNEKDERKVYAIDFGHCFCSPNWNAEKVKFFQEFIQNIRSNYCKNFVDNFLTQSFKVGKYGRGFGEIFRAMEINIFFDKGNPFQRIVSKIESLDEQVVREMLYNIPDEWFISDMQQSLYLQFILKNKSIVRDAINYMYKLGAFSNSLGGILKWDQEKNIGIR